MMTRKGAESETVVQALIAEGRTLDEIIFITKFSRNRIYSHMTREQRVQLRKHPQPRVPPTEEQIRLAIEMLADEVRVAEWDGKPLNSNSNFVYGRHSDQSIAHTVGITVDQLQGIKKRRDREAR